MPRLFGCAAGPDGVRVERFEAAPAGPLLHLNATHFAEMPILRTLIDANRDPGAYPAARAVNATTIEYGLDRATSRALASYLEGKAIGADWVVAADGDYFDLEVYKAAC